ncbi:tripartite-type tricarboxylate transporter receptor subunit TctC [Sporomusaceae bacterium BoRhaA]|nr:tripartite tricarboxylate transporter substrate-binding protein [Pelorhabdus rhamnosifermentans]MBU2701288.1 tripartite-type tricarboxylate transporter receptor subunit TctC [Pelorhabdus rhamnosifermentans]
MAAKIFPRHYHRPFVNVQANQPWQTLDDLIAYAKAHPGQLKSGHSGVGSYAHVASTMFAHETGITLEQVPFRGGVNLLLHYLVDMFKLFLQILP